MTDKVMIIETRNSFAKWFTRILNLVLLLATQYVNYKYLGNSTLILLVVITTWFVIPFVFKKAVKAGMKNKHSGIFTDSKTAKEFVDECFVK